MIQPYQYALILPPLPQRHNITDNQLRHRHQPTTPHTRKCTKDNKLEACLRQGSCERPKEEDPDADGQQHLAGPDIGESSIEQLEGR